jgi:hypothetical protein
MRINVYSQELTSEVIHVSKESNGREVTGVPCSPNGTPNGKPRERLPGFLVEIWERGGRPQRMDATNPFLDVRETAVTYHAAQLILHSSDRLHHPPVDDDRSAVTFWMPRSKERRLEMAKAFDRIAELFRTAPLEIEECQTAVAACPPGYQDMTPQEQWEFDKQLGRLDDES